MNHLKIIFVAVIFCALVYETFSAHADCPLSSQMTSCSPKCTEDNQCSPGSKCCPNICNTKSCSQPNRSNSGSGGYKGSSSSATGTYCGNSKCNSYEKCEFDKSTKRQKCVRT